MNKIFFIFAAAALCGAPCHAQDLTAPAAAITQSVAESVSLAPLFSRAEELLGSGVKPLVIFDIDNTVLVSELYLGSEPWYSAAYGQIAPLRQSSPAAFAPKNECLVRLLSRVQAAAPWKIAEPGLAARIAALQAKGVPVLALTSRNHLAVEATLSALKKQGVDFSRTAPWKEFDSFPPWPGARAAIYKGGVCFGRGEDKGRLLLALFEKFAYRPQAVLFADDSAKNTAAVAAALADARIPLNAWRYTAFDALLSRQAQGAPAARVQLEVFTREGRLVSNAEAEKTAASAPVPEARERELLFCE